MKSVYPGSQDMPRQALGGLLKHLLTAAGSSSYHTDSLRRWPRKGF
jgi:hypothetical protein